MSDESIKQLGDTLFAPYGRTIRHQDIMYETGLHILRIHIKEGSRFTVIDLDADTARNWSKIMANWADEDISTNTD